MSADPRDTQNASDDRRVSPAAAAFVRRWCLTLNRPLSLQCRLSSYQGCLPGSASNRKPLDIHGISVHLTAVVSHPSSPRPPRGMPQPHTPLQVSTALLIYRSPSGACGRYCVYIRGRGAADDTDFLFPRPWISWLQEQVCGCIFAPAGPPPRSNAGSAACNIRDI